MIEAGRIFIFFAAAAAVGATILGGRAAVLSERNVAARWSRSAERALISSFVLTFLASGIFLRLLIVHDFEVAYVWSHTSRTLPLVYTISAFWAGQEGSLLFWVLALLAIGVLAVRLHRDSLPELMPTVIAVVAITAFLFLFVLAHVVPPFATIADKFPDAATGTIPGEGFGLNPLLQNPGMVVHPPLLLLGYVGFAIPFAFAVAALAARRVDAAWLRTTRRWTVLSWLSLSLGILAGAKWAYVELGWGGYWAWDPVENASFIPWLTATAYLHSVMIEERRGMFRMWNMILITLTFLLSIFGTFLTRSGLLSSVHSFSGSDVGTYFAVFLGSAALFMGGLIANRRGFLRGDHRIEAFVSREAAFLFNNVILVSMAFAVLWGTIYPIISEYATGERASVGPPFFNRVLLPLSLCLLLLTGLGPVLAWRRANAEGLRRHLALPGAASIAAAVALFAAGLRPISAVIGIGLAIFVIAISAYDHALAASVRSRTTGDSLLSSAWILLRRNGRRYGGYLVHVGISVLFIGVMGSFYNLENTAAIGVGERIDVGGYELTLGAIDEFSESNRDVLVARLAVEKDGRSEGTVAPEISLFRGTGEDQRASEVDIQSGFTGDLYVSLVSLDSTGRAVIQVRWNALVGWVWIGCALLVLGTVFAIMPPPRRAPALAALPALFTERSQVTASLIAAVLILLAEGSAIAEAQPDVRSVASELTCQCACNMNLANCSHASCPERDGMKSEIASLLTDGISPTQIFAKMEEKYGKDVLASPPARGFDRSAWATPFAAVLLAAAAGGFLLCHWRAPHSVDGATLAAPSAIDRAAAEAVQRALEDYR